MQLNKLKEPELKHLKPGMHNDGGSLYLRITPTSKAWVFRYRPKGKISSRDHGLGPYPDVSLAQARGKARELREQRRRGIDPIDVKKGNKNHDKALKTFKQVTNLFIATNKKRWKDPKNQEKWEQSLITKVFPIIGDKSIAAITASDVEQVIRPIWINTPNTGNIIRRRIEKVLDYAKALNFRSGDNPARWSGHLEFVFSHSAEPTKNHPSLPYQDIKQFMKELKQRNGIAAKALQFQIYTATRPNETLQAEWTEIDLNDKTWEIPAKRMKMKKPHKVSLSDQAIEILKDMQQIRINEYVFPSTTNKPIVDQALRYIVNKMRGTQASPHGFRSTFRTWADDQTDAPFEVKEACLAHQVKDETVRAYSRGSFYDKRKDLMLSWANYIS